MDMKILTAAASAALLMGVGQASAATVVIDNFDLDQRVEDAPGPGETTNSQVGPSAGIIGGFRDLLVDTDEEGQQDATELVAQNSQLEFNNDTGVTGRGWVTYDGSNVVGTDPDNVDTNGLNGIDLYGGPIGGGFNFEVIESDAEIFIEITAWDITSAMVSFSELLPAGGGNPFVPFAAFSGDAGFNWNQVGALQFFAQSGDESSVPSLDGAIGSITVETGVIPLPASAFLLLGGVGGLSALGARRRRKS